MRNSLKILFLFFSLSHLSFSQNVDSLQFEKGLSKTFFYTSKQFDCLDSICCPENSIEDFQNYLDRGSLGNSGLAIVDFFYTPFSYDIGFNYSKNNFLKYFYTKDNLKFYDTRVPYTDLFYVIGSKKEQDFKLTFSYNVKQNWNIAVNFFRIRSEGFYLRQNTNDNFISLSSNYKSNNNRYNLLVGIMYNSVQNTENGGILDDSIFENSANLDKKLLAINLVSAKRSFLNRSVFINQYVNFGKKSNDSSLKSSIIPNSYVVLSTAFDDNLLKYEDGNPNSGFYSNIYYDSIITSDSTYNLKFENELSWRRVDNKKHRGITDKAGIALSVKDQFVLVKNRNIDTSFNNVIIGAEFYNTYSDNRLWYVLSGKYDVTGYNEKDYFLKGLVKKGFFDSLTFLSFEVSSRLQTPDFIYNNYTSNNFNWNNSFEKIKENSIGLTFLLKKNKFSIGFNYKEYNNPVYFDNYAVARQYYGNIALLHAYVKKDFVFYNWHLNNNIHYQYVPDSTVIRLPKFVLGHSLFYENYLFKKAMRVQVGLAVFFVSDYFANSYMPATAQFYLQDDNKYGNYPYLDFFVNARIKSLRIFFKIDHVNSGWFGSKYQIAPHYPMNDRAYKLGVSWRFYD